MRWMILKFPARHAWWSAELITSLQRAFVSIRQMLNNLNLSKLISNIQRDPSLVVSSTNTSRVGLQHQFHSTPCWLLGSFRGHLWLCGLLYHGCPQRHILRPHSMRLHVSQSSQRRTTISVYEEVRNRLIEESARVLLLFHTSSVTTPIVYHTTSSHLRSGSWFHCSITLRCRWFPRSEPKVSEGGVIVKMTMDWWCEFVAVVEGNWQL